MVIDNTPDSRFRRKDERDPLIPSFARRTTERRRILGSGTVSFLLLFTVGLFAAGAWPVVRSKHFRVHHESPYAPAGVLNTLEGLRAKLLLNLVAFAPWAKESVVDVYLYKDAASYQSRTGMAPWVGGHVDVARREVHVFEGDQLQRVLAHEMAHLFFDDFFVAKETHPPTWLNEGVARWMEEDYGADSSGDDRHFASHYEPLNDFFLFSYHHSQRTSQQVSLWYSQASSLVRFLNRRFAAHQFVRFCELLRDGSPLEKAVPAAYGLNVPDVAALERLWRENLENP
jgi:hypothetical protein